MKFSELYTTLQKHKYYVFSNEDVFAFYPNEKRSNLKEMIYRWTKRGWLASLKRGLYELSYPQDLAIPDMYIANKLYAPSYVSLETALSNYSIIPEVAMAVTSVTTKPTRMFRNKHGLFIYRTIQPEAFTGYYVEKSGSFQILMAEPEKAIVDYLYFITRHNKKLRLQDERIEKDSLSHLNRKKLNKYAGLYNLNLKELYALL